MKAQGARMVDVGDKPLVDRTAEARGTLRLKPSTIKAIQTNTVEKGDVLEIARVAAILAAKRTPDQLPLTHPIPLDAVEVRFDVQRDALTVNVVVRAHWRTGVEMEALTAATTALLTAWDLCKPLEKDERGQYPTTVLEDVRVVRKEKGA